MEEYIRVKVVAVINREDIINAMKEHGIIINKANEKKYINLIKNVVKIKAKKDFPILKNIPREDLLMHGFSFE